jgi:HEAT repeat protein
MRWSILVLTLTFIETQDDPVRARTAEHVARLGGTARVSPAVRAGLLGLVANETPHVRGSAARALGYLGVGEAVPKSALLLKDADHAADALRGMVDSPHVRSSFAAVVEGNRIRILPRGEAVQR